MIQPSLGAWGPTESISVSVAWAATPSLSPHFLVAPALPQQKLNPGQNLESMESMTPLKLGKAAGGVYISLAPLRL